MLPELSSTSPAIEKPDLNEHGLTGLLVGELGLGPDENKSATKATKNKPLLEVDVIEYALVIPVSQFPLPNE